MVKITTDVAGDGALLIRVAGRLQWEDCDALGRMLDDASSQNRQVRIDLGSVALADRPSIEYLAGLWRRQIALDNVPPYIERWIARLARGRGS